MKGSSKVLIGVGLGILAGGVAGYFLASEEGREFQRKTKAQLDKLSEEVTTKIKENSNLATEKLTEATDSAKKMANDVSATLKQKLNKTGNIAEDAVEKVTDNFQEGVEAARRKINEQSGHIDNGIVNS